MGEKMKKWAAVLAVALLCAGAAGMAAPMQVMAAEETELTTVVTTQRCSIWSAPATTEENRVKYVDAGYQITIYPEVIESELGDGKIFYRTMKGAYVLCRCVEGTGIGTESEAQNENPSVPEDNGILIPVGNVPRKVTVNINYYVSHAEIWISYENDDGGEHYWGIYAEEEQDIPSTDSYGITYRGYMTDYAKTVVAQAAAGDAEIAQLLADYGKKFLICNSTHIMESEIVGNESDVSYTTGWVWDDLEFQSGTGICILITLYPENGVEDSVSRLTECLHTIAQYSEWLEENFRY